MCQVEHISMLQYLYTVMYKLHYLMLEYLPIAYVNLSSLTL